LGGEIFLCVILFKVGNQSFNASEVPVALVLTDDDLVQIGGIALKQGGLSLYVRTPADVDFHTLAAWLTEAAPELDLKTLAPRLYACRPVKDPPR
jgi:hypothetical protein